MCPLTNEHITKLIFKVCFLAGNPFHIKHCECGRKSLIGKPDQLVLFKSHYTGINVKIYIKTKHTLEGALEEVPPDCSI